MPESQYGPEPAGAAQPKNAAPANTPKQGPRIPLEDETYSPIFVARQPIFDQNNNIWAYELLFRKSQDAETAQVMDQDAATAQVIVEGFSMATFDEDTETKYFINFPENLILKGSPLALPAASCVIEILETVTPTPKIIEACKSLKEAGYTLALDDFVDQTDMDDLLSLADIVKVDVAALDTPQLIKLTQRLQRWSCALLAEKVEQPGTYRLLKTLGYTYFQGYLFSRPKLIEGRTISAEGVSKVRLLKELSKGNFDVNQLSKIISNDISLSYRLIKYINSVYHGLLHEITSIQQAIILLGYLPLQHWLLMVILSDLAITPATREISFLSVKRAKFLELLAKESDFSQIKQDTLFMLGLFSKLDALMGMPMAELLPSMPLDPKIKEALSENSKNELTMWIHMAESIDNGNWAVASQQLTTLGVSLEKAAMLHARALKWARVNLQVVSQPQKVKPKNG